MTGVDTNVLARYIVHDDTRQSAAAIDLVEKSFSVANPGFISVVTTAELAWVLKSVYKFTGTEIAKAVEMLLQADSFVVQHEQEVFNAMIALKTGRASFADALIGELGAYAGCEKTYTFDRQASQLSTFELVPFPFLT